jgi:hypothetical protein
VDRTSRFASFRTRTSPFASFAADGELTALVAEGLPEYPENGDLSALSDEQVGELHDALVDSIPALSEDPNFDPADATVLADRVTALREEAERRMSAAPADGDSDEGQSDTSAGASAAGTGDAAERIAALERLNGLAEAASTGDSGESLPGGELLSVAAPALSAEDIASAVTAGITAAAPSIAEAATAGAAQPHRGPSARDLAGYAPRGTEPGPGAGMPTVARRGRLLAAGDIPGRAMGAELETIDDVVEAFRSRWNNIGRTSQGVEDEKVVVGTLAFSDSDIPEGRDLRGLNGEADRGEIKRRIRAAIGQGAMGIDPWTREERPIGRGGIAVADPEALVASGGLAAPVEPYYPQLHVGQAAMPTFDAIPGFTAERGGIRLVSPASLNTLATATVVGEFTDGVGAGTTTFTSATADFTNSDLYQPIVQVGGSANIPVGTIITAIGSSSSVTVSQDVVTGTGIVFRLPSRNPNNLGPAVGLVTAAQDAAGPPNVIKFTYDVPDGTQIEHDVYSVYTSLQFANLTARTFPEQVELNILLANDLAARISEQAALDYITNWSAIFTGAKTFGTARQLLAQLEHEAAYLRNSLRMDPMAVLRLGLPAWAVNAMRGDYISTFIGGGESWGLSDDELTAWFQDRALLPFFYQDGPSDISQLFPVAGSGAINQGSFTATPIAIPDYPGTGSSTSFRTQVISFMWPEGTWLGLTTGELNIGLVRDSILNSQNRFRNFEERWVTPGFVGSIGSSLRCEHTVAADGTYGAAASVVLGAGNGL